MDSDKTSTTINYANLYTEQPFESRSIELRANFISTPSNTTRSEYKRIQKRTLIAACAVVLASLSCATAACGETTIAIDAQKNAHLINPLIYGVAGASQSILSKLKAPLNRSGGNDMTDYSWQSNAKNLNAGWYFESYPGKSAEQGAEVSSFVAHTKSMGAEPMVTVPLIGWVANTTSDRSILPSYSVTKYGAQCAVDPYFPDAGNGLLPDCITPITNNDPRDAYMPDSPQLEQKWINRLIKRWGKSDQGGVGYYLMDNEASTWHSTHRDIHPVGSHAEEYRDMVINEAKEIKSADAHAKIVAPEEWGWWAYFTSGYDQQYTNQHGYNFWPDRQGEQSGLLYIPWLLSQWKAAGHPIDVLSVHFYPEGGEFSDDDSPAMQLLRNRSTRQLWDPNYVSESPIGATVNLISLLKNWVSTYYYTGTPVAITEYSWGDEGSINGATAQADIYGIFGRQGLDMATRLEAPNPKTPTFKAMQMYRNYDGAGSAFGDTSISASAPSPDNVAAFAALRSSDGNMTVMVINKMLDKHGPIALKLGHFASTGSAVVYRLTKNNKIEKLPNIAWAGNLLKDSPPPQSITLYVLPPG